MPRNSRILLICVLMAGWLAGWMVAPVLWILTAGVAATLFAADRDARRRTPLSAPPVDVSLLPSRLRRAVTDTLETIGKGRASHALEDIARRAAPLLQELENRPDDRQLHRDVVALVDAACTIASELDRVDGFLGMPESEHTQEARERCKAGATRLATRLTDASAAIETMHAQLLEEGSSASDRVSELASELTKEAAARQAATQELAQLLSGVAAGA
jgi:hypothetical protein